MGASGVETFVIPCESAEPQAFASWADAIRDVFTIEPIAGGAHSVQVETWHLGALMLGRFRAPPTCFTRSPRLVASSGLDHLMVQLYEEGGFEGFARDAGVCVAAGDLVVFDLTQPIATEASAFANITLLLPRGAIRDRIPEPGLLHGHVVPAGSALGGLLADAMRSLVARADTLDTDIALAVSAATAAYFGTLLAGITPTTHASTGASVLHRAIGFIDAHLTEPELDVARVARGIGQSRAALYRTFRDLGGVAAHIRQRRLTGAALELAQRPGVRLATVARRWGFRDQSTFQRAFRKAFGVAPGQIGSERLATEATGSLTPEQRFQRWLRTLG